MPKFALTIRILVSSYICYILQSEEKSEIRKQIETISSCSSIIGILLNFMAEYILTYKNKFLVTSISNYDLGTDAVHLIHVQDLPNHDEMEVFHGELVHE